MVMQWIDRVAGLAYVCVRGRLTACQEFLASIDALTKHPHWFPGMPILEDMREAEPVVPRNFVEEWRTFLAAHRQLLKRCRWAVVRSGEHHALIDVLDAAARDATASDVMLRQFTNTIDAHEWLQSKRIVRPDDELRAVTVLIWPFWPTRL